MSFRFNALNNSVDPSTEGLLKLIKDNIISRFFSKPESNVSIPVSSGLFSDMLNFEPVREDGNYVIIRNFPIGWFRRLSKRKYGSHKLANMLEKVGVMLMSSSATVRVHKFFLPELVYILAQGNGGNANQKLIDRIVAVTWLKDLYVAGNEFSNSADLSRVDRDMNVKLFDWQKEFIGLYDVKRQRAHLNGELLSFGCGLGKTITALALMKAIGCDAVVVIAPKSTLEDVWVDHLKRFFKKEPRWYLVNKSQPSDAEYFIFNYESMDKVDSVLKYLKAKKNVGIVVDESHNFLKMSSNRTQNLIKLRDDLDCHNVLMQSGTPIKAIGNECIPLLRVIDSFFDDDAERIFKSAFGLSTTLGTDILHARMNLMMHRRTMEDVFTLPEKTSENIEVKIKDGGEYTITNVKKELAAYLEDRKSYHNGRKRIYEEEWNRCMEYFNSSRDLTRTPEWVKYCRIIDKLLKFGYDRFDRELVADVTWANAYERNTLEPMLPKNLRGEFRDCKAAIKYLNLKLQGEVLGKLDQIRSRMVTSMLHGVDLEDIISSSLKKVIFFTTYVDTVETLDKILRSKGCKPICVYGQTSKDSATLLNKFREDKNSNVLIATIQTLATGVTLVEANTVVFLNDPWRDADKEQASNRIWRIGQDTPCFIYTLHLDTGDQKNLSDRTADILDWSKQMTDAIVNGK